MLARGNKKSKPNSSSNSNGNSKGKVAKTTKSLSQSLPQSTKKKRAAMGPSSSQPLPPPIASNYLPTPTWSGRGRRTTAAELTSKNSSKQAKKGNQKKAAAKSSNKPSTISTSQPSKLAIKETAKPNSKPSSSQPVGSRPIFCVRHVGEPHVSPQRLKQMAKLPPRAWENIK
ncbi:hypothetical protein PIB30_009042 [Stylosanthes scabra]|uniref:Uncharacterized protein n=1 Tax=Stylosanthes scabra TaxID=79078 RepID=A0ABU6U4Z1_9FABA|nr:hypothetical protein [Stylosanthes scabra]